MNKKELQEKWNKMSESEKAEWNGFDGFVKKERRIDSKLFKPSRRKI